MAEQKASIRKNGKVLLDNVQVWINCDADPEGGKACWGYLNPAWEDPIGVLDPDRESDPRYELQIGQDDPLTIEVEDHRDAHFIQVNQNGYRTVHFRTAH